MLNHGGKLTIQELPLILCDGCGLRRLLASILIIKLLGPARCDCAEAGVAGARSLSLLIPDGFGLLSVVGGGGRLLSLEGRGQPRLVALPLLLAVD